LAMLRLPDRIRGYEQVKLRNAEQARSEAAGLMEELRAAKPKEAMVV